MKYDVPSNAHVRHLSACELQRRLDDHNKALEGRGVSCQCMECLYNRWYWTMQYHTKYPELPEWAKKKEA